MKKILLGTICLATLLTGCTTIPQDASALSSRWVVSAIDGHKSPVEALPTTSVLTISPDFSVSYKGCNTLTGNLLIANNEIGTNNLASTRMMCMNNEQKVVDGFVKKMLTGPSHYLVNQNTLILSSHRHTVTFKREQQL